MEFSSWVIFASIILLASISPGPNVLAVVIHTLDAGARGAISTIVGNLVALFTIAAAAAIGVGALLHAAPNVFMAMKLAGGLYLTWMGIKMIKSSFDSMSPLDIASKGKESVKSVEYSIRAMLISYSHCFSHSWHLRFYCLAYARWFGWNKCQENYGACFRGNFPGFWSGLCL